MTRATPESPIDLYQRHRFLVLLVMLLTLLVLQPIVFGFDWFFVFATVMFWSTALVTFLFFRNLGSVPAHASAA